MSEFVIEDGIELPKVTHSGRAKGELKYPFRLLEVGQSFLVENEVPDVKLSRRLSSSASQVRKADGKKFAQRMVREDGVSGYRVWRIL